MNDGEEIGVAYQSQQQRKTIEEILSTGRMKYMTNDRRDHRHNIVKTVSESAVIIL